MVNRRLNYERNIRFIGSYLVYDFLFVDGSYEF
jgi:hypothetical protein